MLCQKASPSTLSSMPSADNADVFSDPMRAAYEAIVSVEQDYGAHDLTVDGVHIWSAMRLRIAEKLMLALGLWDRPLAKHIPRSSRMGAFPRNLTARNPFLRRGPFSNFVMKWERSQQVEGGLDDVVTRPLRNLLPAEDTRYMHMLGTVPASHPGDLSFEAISVAVRMQTSANPARLSTTERARIEDIQAAIEKRLSTRIDLATIVANGAAEFRAQRDIFIPLFRRWHLRRLFMVVAYARAAAIAAARSCGATTIELQHGLIHQSHFGYDFPEGLRPAYRPDVLLLYGDHWRDAARHYSGTRLEVFGAPYMREYLQRADSKTTGRREPSVLFISQAGIFKSILEFALEFSRQPGAPKTILRLHPADDVELVRMLVTGSGVGAERFEISTGGGGPRTLELQATHSVQVGAFSTAILEGAALGCRTFLIPVPGWSALSGLLEAGYARAVTTPPALLDAVRQPIPAGQEHFGADALNHMFAEARPQVIADLLKAG